jgi:hypothetical protein
LGLIALSACAVCRIAELFGVFRLLRFLALRDTDKLAPFILFFNQRLSLVEFKKQKTALSWAVGLVCLI